MLRCESRGDEKRVKNYFLPVALSLLLLTMCAFFFHPHAHAECMTGIWVSLYGDILVVQQNGDAIRGIMTTDLLWPCYLGFVGQCNEGSLAMIGRPSEGCFSPYIDWVYLIGRTDCRIAGLVLYPGGNTSYLLKVSERDALTGSPQNDQ